MLGLALIGVGVYLEIRTHLNPVDTDGTETSSVKANTFFRSDFPSRFGTDLEQASELWLVGITLRQLIQFTTIELKLQKGHSVKVLIVRPDGAGLSIAESRVHGRVDLEERRSNTMSVLKDLCTLRQAHPKTRGAHD